MHSAFVALGSNMGDRVQNIIQARNVLRDLSTHGQLTSSGLYLTSPVGGLAQKNYINCVVHVISNKSCEDFFADAQSLETQLGRLRDSNEQNAPRVIDIDLILYGESQRADSHLTVPHPRYKQRLFVLLPLLELLRLPHLPIPDTRRQFLLGQTETILLENTHQNLFIEQSIQRLN